MDGAATPVMDSRIREAIAHARTQHALFGGQLIDRAGGIVAVGFHEAEFVMRQLAQETGGRSFFPSKIDDLNGVTIDYVTSMQGSGFTFKNPNSTGGCGCGSSFSA